MGQPMQSLVGYVITIYKKNRPLKNSWKSVKIWQSYGYEFVALFFWPTLYAGVKVSRMEGKEKLSVICTEAMV